MNISAINLKRKQIINKSFLMIIFMANIIFVLMGVILKQNKQNLQYYV
jgi:hypothetical protein